MTIGEIRRLLDAEIYCGEDMQDTEVLYGCACDMMSDILALVEHQAVMLTGLVNPQVVRTAEMLDISCVVLVRGKVPTEAMIELAKDRDLPLLSTKHRMFGACGILTEAGLLDEETN